MSINFSSATKSSKFIEFNFTSSWKSNIFCEYLLQNLCPVGVSVRVVSSFNSAYLIFSVTKLPSSKTFVFMNIFWISLSKKFEKTKQIPLEKKDCKGNLNEVICGSCFY